MKRGLDLRAGSLSTSVVDYNGLYDPQEQSLGVADVSGSRIGRDPKIGFLDKILGLIAEAAAQSRL